MRGSSNGLPARGGFFSSIPEPPASDIPDSGNESNRQEFADLLQVIAAAASDTRSHPPRPNKSRRWGIEIVTEVRPCCEEGILPR